MRYLVRGRAVVVVAHAATIVNLLFVRLDSHFSLDEKEKDDFYYLLVLQQ